MVEAILGLNAGDLSCKTADFAKHMHPADAERFKLLLWSVRERGSGEVRIEFRMRHADNSYRWFELEAASVPSQDRRAVRCVGLLREVTESKRAQDRLLHDAVNDSLTGLPNRELFLDRLAIAAKRAALEPLVRPALLFIDIDRFKAVNSSFGLVVGDSLLLTVATSAPLPVASAAISVPRIRWAASAATSSPCCCSASPIHGSWPCSQSRCADRCARRSSWRARRSC